MTGCMASVILITKKKIFVANIGNSKVYLVKDKKYTPLIENHHPDAFD